MDIASPAVPVGDPVGELLALILARTADDNQAVVVTENRAPHCIVHVNDKWVTLCGFSQAEAVGESSSILQGSRTDTNVVRRLMDGVQRGEPTGAYIWNYKKDGTCFLNRLRIWPLRAFCVARLTEVRLPLLQGFFGELLPKYRVLYDSEAYIEDDCYGCDRMVVETAEAG